jgi:hypothetical protein
VAKIETTTKKFKEGVRLSGDKTEIHWESTGYIAVRLTDEFGEGPLAKRGLTVDIPKEGVVELTTDDDGCVRHPDVPFQEYEIDLGDDKRVHIPAVADPRDLHERHVPGVFHAFANLVVSDEAGDLVVDTDLSVEGPDGSTFVVRTDANGLANDPTPRPPGSYTIRAPAGVATDALASRRTGIAIVTLKPEASS